MLNAAQLKHLETALGSDAWLFERLDRLARGRADELSAFLHHVPPPTAIPNSRSTCRTHYVLCGPNGEPRVAELARFMATKTLEYCIPRSRLHEAYNFLNDTGSPSRLIALQREANSLFVDLKNSGEGGELLLYLFLEVVLGYPQVLCKMSLKTSQSMHVHGVDGVHVAPVGEGRLGLYWGESKLYATPAAAIRECLSSIAPFLLGTSGQQDMFLMRSYADAGPQPDGLTEALRGFFTEYDERNSRLDIRGACMIGFSLDQYPDLRTADASARGAVEAAIKSWVTTLDARLVAEKLGRVVIEVFFVPFPDVEAFREAVQEAL